MPDKIKKPVTVNEIDKYLKEKDAAKKKSIDIQRRFFLAADKEPKLKTRLVPIVGRGQKKSWEIVIDIEGVNAGERATAAPLKGKASKIEKRKISEEELSKHLTAFIPDHLAFSPVPKQFVKSTRQIIDTNRKRRIPTTIFGTDDRRAFQDTSYPWGTVGRVETNRGIGSGVMIGPRHLLTVSHIIDWDGPEGFAADWVKFTPSYFDGNAPFGETWGTNIYWFVKENGDGSVSSDEAKHDYVVVVLDQRIGELTGWMGARGYDDDWDSLNAWSHMGYPADLTGAQRPTWQGWFRVDGSDDAAQEILHQADVFPGQSGGPVFGFWDGDVGPRAIAVQSWQNADTNGASGSMDMRDLVVQARTDFP